MGPKRRFYTEVISKEKARAGLAKLRSKGAKAKRRSKFDPLRQHIQWLEYDQALRIEGLTATDVANLRGYVERNIPPLRDELTFDIRSRRADAMGKKYRAYIFCQRAKG